MLDYKLSGINQKMVPALEDVLDSGLKAQYVIVGWEYLLDAAHATEITPVFNMKLQYLYE